MNGHPSVVGGFGSDARRPRRSECSLSIIVPTLNESGNIRPFAQAVERALGPSGWEIIFVDDDSSDGTAAVAKDLARADPRVRCIRRIGRRGLSSAVIEGAMASSADYIAVIDADLQHDEQLLKTMIGVLETDQADVVVASRFAPEGDASGLDGSRRHLLSSSGNWMVQTLLKIHIFDPMSGFFMIRRQVFDEHASKLSGRGFKILVDLLASSPTRLRVMELPMRFRPRNSGSSKLDLSVELAFLAMLLEKTGGGIVSPRFLAFSLVGGTGILVHLVVLRLALAASFPFAFSQALAGVVAMTSNFWLNNATTYRDQKLVGWRFLSGLLSFYAICSVGFFTNVGVSQALFAQHYSWWLSGVLGAAVGAVWNYSVSSAMTWKRR